MICFLVDSVLNKLEFLETKLKADSKNPRGFEGSRTALKVKEEDC